MKLGVTADVFDDHWYFEIVADFANFLGRQASRFERIGHREEIVGVAAVDAAPTEMVGEPRGFGSANESFQAAKVFAIQFFRGAEVHGHAVLDNFVALENLVENLEGTAAVNHEIFRDDLEPVAGRLAGKDVVVVRDA
jgi:hypothetical protein